MAITKAKNNTKSHLADHFVRDELIVGGKAHVNEATTVRHNPGCWRKLGCRYVIILVVWVCSWHTTYVMFVMTIKSCDVADAHSALVP